MSDKSKPASKIAAAGKNMNRKKTQKGDKNKFDPAFFKKNEFALILLGALLLTVIIFFVFFRTSDRPSQQAAVARTQISSFEKIEKRISAIEKSLASKSNMQDELSSQPPVKDIQGLDNRLTRLETAFLVKFESLIERMESIEKKMTSIKASQRAAAKPAVKDKAPQPAPAAKPTVKKAVKKEKKAAIFHTVAKGETLYSISKKYDTTVSALRKLNKLSEKDKIYPGDSIIIR